jgi:nuclear transport factor 2 (NTF2) superfamily protein
MPNRIEARSAKAALTNATGRLPLLRLFSTPLDDGLIGLSHRDFAWPRQAEPDNHPSIHPIDG